MTAKERRTEKAAKIRGLYCITTEKFSLGRDNIEVVKAMLDGGAKIVQYREKEMPVLRRYRQCVKIRDMTRRRGALLIIDDSVDLALAVGADGVHIGQDDLPIEKVRDIAGEDMIIGLSTHNPAQAEDAQRRGADYIGAGPVFETHTKSDVCAPVGISYIDYASRFVRLPFVAIGGIKCGNAEEVLRHGAKCVSLVTGIVGADDITGTVSELVKIINGYNLHGGSN